MTATGTVRDSGIRRLARARAVASAVTGPVAIWAVADPLLGHDLEVEQWNSGTTMAVGPTEVIVSAALSALAAWALLAILEKVTPRARRIWTAVAVVVLVLSLAGPATAGVDAGTAVTLGLMHLAVGAILIPTLPRR